MRAAGHRPALDQADSAKPIDDLEARIEEELVRRGGFWAISDSSPAEVIHQALGVSKKAFKQAAGALLKKRRITIDDEGIRRVEA